MNDNDILQQRKERRNRSATPYDRIHYHVAYCSIPGVIKAISTYPDKTALKLDNKRMLALGLLPELTREDLAAFPWDDLKISKMAIGDGWHLMIYAFPEPRRSPQAKFGAILLDSEDCPRDYVTLERANRVEDNEIEDCTPELNTNPTWLLGSMIIRTDNSSIHMNYGFMPLDPTLENFISAVMEIFNTPLNERPIRTITEL